MYRTSVLEFASDIFPLDGEHFVEINSEKIINHSFKNHLDDLRIISNVQSFVSSIALWKGMHELLNDKVMCIGTTKSQKQCWHSLLLDNCFEKFPHFSPIRF